MASETATPISDTDGAASRTANADRSTPELADSEQANSEHRSGVPAELLLAVRGIPGIIVRENVPASSVTTMAVGGPLRVLVTAETEAGLRELGFFLSRNRQSFRILGNGSNLLVSDGGLDEWVVTLGSGFRGYHSVGSGEVLVRGGTSLMSCARRISDSGYSGLEFAAGIPACVGGATAMNAGAHGAEIGERISKVTVVVDGRTEELVGDSLPWAYRSSGLPAGAIVTEVVLRMIPGQPERIAAACRSYLEERKRRQPLSQPSSGSVFKNPSEDQPAGRLIEQAGLKGRAIGGARVSDKHANWIVNPDKRASSSDVAALIELCRREVLEQSGIELHPEVKLWSQR